MFNNRVGKNIFKNLKNFYYIKLTWVVDNGKWSSTDLPSSKDFPYLYEKSFKICECDFLLKNMIFLVLQELFTKNKITVRAVCIESFG